VFYLDRYADPGAPDPPLEEDDGIALAALSSMSMDRKPLPFTTLDATAALLRLHVRLCVPG
jgi:hypothetical protein